jgi:VanZ family protein
MNTQSIPIDEKLLFKHFDKVVHLLMYFSLTFTFAIENYISNNYKINKTQFFVIIMTSAIIGVGLELAQSFFTTYRTGDFFDEMANLSGVLLAVLVFLLLKSKLKKWITALKLDKI